MSDFEAAALDATSQLEALGNPPAAEPTAEASESPAVEAPVAETPPAPVSLTDDSLVEVMVNGEVKQLPWKEAKASIMMQQDYTRKTQELAEHRKQIEAAVNAQREREAQINAVLQDPVRLSAWLQKLQGQTPDPSSPITAETFQQALEAQKAQFESTLQQKVVEAKTEIEIAQEAKGVRMEIEKTWASVYEQHPALKFLPELKASIEAQVGRMGLSTVAEAQQHVAALARAKAAEIDSVYQSQQKMAAVEKAKLVTGIEPPGGKGLPPAPQKFKSFDDPGLEASLTAEIAKLMGGA